MPAPSVRRPVHLARKLLVLLPSRKGTRIQLLPFSQTCSSYRQTTPAGLENYSSGESHYTQITIPQAETSHGAVHLSGTPWLRPEARLDRGAAWGLQCFQLTHLTKRSQKGWHTHWRTIPASPAAGKINFLTKPQKGLPPPGWYPDRKTWNRSFESPPAVSGFAIGYREPRRASPGWTEDS